MQKLVSALIVGAFVATASPVFAQAPAAPASAPAKKEEKKDAKKEVKKEKKEKKGGC